MRSVPWTRQIRNNQSGLSLVELLIAMALFVIVASGITFVVIDAMLATQHGKDYGVANYLNQEALEASASIRNRGWKNLTIGTHGFDNTSSYWDFAGTSNTIGQYSRRLIVDTVNRDENDDIVDIGGTLDPDTKKLTIQTTWPITPTRSGSTSFETYLTNWRSTKWLQTTQADFNQGTLTNAVVTANSDGEVELASGTNNASKNWPFDVPTNYTYNSTLIDVIASNAQLASQSTVTSNGTINPDFTSTLLPWTYTDWNQDQGEVNVTGIQRSSGGNPGGYAHLRIPSGKEDEVGGFFQQSFQITKDNPDLGTVSFDWRVSDFSGTPITLQAYAFLDTVPGEPLIGTEIWSSGEIIGITSWSTKNIDITSRIASQGTYYLKLAAWVETGNNNTGRFDFNFDNVSAHWEKAAGSSYPITDPTIEPTTSFSDSNLTAWTGFSETSLKDAGGEIYYQLSDDNGATWQFWNGLVWATAGASDYNTATVVDTNIPTFPTTNQQLLFKSFLSSDGAAQVQLDDVTVSYESQSGGTFELTGTYDSPTYDTTSVIALYNYIEWTITTPPSSSIEFQIRTADTQANLSGATWVGPDGTNGTRYSTSGEEITLDPGALGNRWVQLRAYLTGDGSVTPILEEVTIDYET